MRPPGAPDQLEQRRRRAVQLLQAGQPTSAVARQVQASASSVWRWWQTYQRARPRGLRPTPTPGRPPRLSEGQRRTLERILARGPRRAGYPTGLWTLARVGKVIQRQFGTRYHPSHVWRLLTARGWQCQPLELSETEKLTLRRLLQRSHLNTPQPGPTGFRSAPSRRSGVGESRLSSRSVEMHRRAVNRRHERHAKALFLQNTGRILVDRLRRPAAV